MEWCGFADRLGIVVSDLMQKNIGGLATVLTNRKRQVEDLLLRQGEENNGSDRNDNNDDDDDTFLGGSTILSMLSDVAFENGLNGLVVQFPAGF